MKKFIYLLVLCLAFMMQDAFAAFDIITPKATDVFRPGQGVYISWTRQEYPVLFENGWNYADYYEVELTGTTLSNGVEVWTYWTADVWFGEGPDRNCTFTIPCDAVGIWAVKITAYDRTIWNKAIVAAGSFNVLEINAPLPSVFVKCKTEPYTIAISNPQKYDRMDLYASINSTSPFAQVPAVGNFFFYNDTSTTTNAFYARFVANTGSNCPPLVSLATPMAVIVFPDEIKQVIKDSVDIIDFMDDSCTNPLSYYDLDAEISVPLGEVIKDAINNLMDSTLDIVDVTEARIEFSWEDQNYITHAFDTLPNGTVVQRQRVCASDDLPDEPGSCRTYQLRAVAHAKAYLKNQSGDIVYAPDIRCNLGMIRETKVCKKMIPPPNDVILLCKEGMQTATLNNYYNYPSVEWFAMQEFEDPIHTGYSWAQIWLARFNHTYTYKVRHVASNGRKSPFALVRVAVLPSFRTDAVDILVNKPLNEPDNCEEAGTYYNLELTQETKTVKYKEFINLVDLKTTADLDISFENMWMDTAYITEKQGLLGIEERACYKTLPAEGGSCRLYWKNGTAEVKVEMTNPLDPLGAKLSHTERCDVDLVQVNVCKTMYPPKPEVIVLCKEGPGTVTLDPNQEQYADVLWYDVKNPDVVVNHGQIYYKEDWGQENGEGRIDDNIQTFYVYNVNSNGKKSTSPSVVQVIILPSIATTHTQAVITAPILTSEGDLEGYCTSLPNEVSSYHDLGYDPAAYVQEVNNLVQFINDNNTIFHTAAQAAVNVRWENQDSISHPDYEPAIERVCFGNLPEGEETCQEYRCYLDVHYIFEMNPNLFPQVSTDLDTLVQEQGTCPVPVKTVTVCKSPLDPGEGDKCRPEPPGPTVLLAYTDCQTQELLIACPNKQYLLKDPMARLQYNGYTVTYDWDEPFGVSGSLSSYNKYQTMLNASIPPKALYLKYRLTRKFTPIASAPPRPDETYCVMFYVCEENCSDNARMAGKPEQENPVIVTGGTKPSIVNMYPDPAHNELNVMYNLPEGVQGELIVSNLLGQVIDRIITDAGSVQAKLNLTNYRPGTYICTLLSGDGSVSAGRFTVIK